MVPFAVAGWVRCRPTGPAVESPAESPAQPGSPPRSTDPGAEPSQDDRLTGDPRHIPTCSTSPTAQRPPLPSSLCPAATPTTGQTLSPG